MHPSDPRMRLLSKQQTLERKEEIIFAIKAGKIFIYPTDTIYGIGCDAKNKKGVKKIREIKHRETKPFSVVVPSKEWILENCNLRNETKLDLLPGPYTLILKIKNTEAVAKGVTGSGTLGVRIPANWFSEIISEAGVPFVTTSVNISGQKNMEAIEDVPQSILDSVDYVIYDGPIRGNPSKKVDLTS